MTYVIYYVLDQTGGLLHVVEILSMVFPRKKYIQEKLLEALKYYKKCHYCCNFFSSISPLVEWRDASFQMIEKRFFTAWSLPPGFFFFFFAFLGSNPQCMGGPRLVVKPELQLPAYTAVTATWEPSRICDLHHNSRQRWIPDPLSKARDWTHNPMNTRPMFRFVSTEPRWELHLQDSCYLSSHTPFWPRH